MHVVHLEDDAPLREILRASFQAADPDIDLIQFITSDEALEYIEENVDTIDLYVFDIRVPGSLDGIDLARKVRELDAPGVIVLTSAYSPPKRELLHELQCEWFPKPWHIMETTKKLFELARR
jgi:DNA-binding response OmpR family regulator